MRFINNLTIKAKLGILFSILLLIITFSSINIYGLGANNLKHNAVHRNVNDILHKYSMVVIPLVKIQEKLERDIFFSKKINPNLSKEIESSMHKLEEVFFNSKEKSKYVLWEEYREKDRMLIHPEEENTIFNDNEKVHYILWKNYKEKVLMLINNVKEKDISKILSLHKELHIEFDALFYELVKQNEKHIEAMKKLDSIAQSESLSILNYNRLYISLILFITIFLGWIISTNILNSLKKVNTGLKDFFEFLNNKSSKIEKIDFENNNEFSEMAHNINVNVDKIQNSIREDIKLIEESTTLLEKIKEGDLSLRLTSTTQNETLNKLKSMMNNMLDNLENQIQKEIDKRIEQEQLLVQQSKLAAMGEMIGNIAHQWRQPIAQISAILLNIQARQEFNQCSKEYFDKKVEDANKLTEYMSQTISDFQNFFKPDSAKSIFSIKQACKEALFIINASLKYHGINLIFEGVEDSEIQGYKNEYSQVILNILNNARDVLLERQIENPKIIVTIKNGDNYGLVKIEDNAGGVPDNIIKNIFEPYFTTKHKSKGTGIGLYMSKTIIENNMNGFINIKNTSDGACFTIKVIK